VDLRDLVVAPESAVLRDLMISPVVTADHDCLREDLVALFVKYQFHMLRWWTRMTGCWASSATGTS